LIAEHVDRRVGVEIRGHIDVLIVVVLESRNYGRKKWEEGKCPESSESPSVGLRLGAKITNHAGSSTVLCFQQ